MTLPEDWQEQIHEGQCLRGWIVNSFAQVEYLLGDLILRCSKIPEYESDVRNVPHGAPDRIKRVRSILKRSGRLDPDAVHLHEILDHLAVQQDTRNLLVHGFATVLHTPRSELGFRFQKFHRQPDRPDARLVRTFTLLQLREERDAQASFADAALGRFRTMHERLAWNGPLADIFQEHEPIE